MHELQSVKYVKGLLFLTSIWSSFIWGLGRGDSSSSELAAWFDVVSWVLWLRCRCTVPQEYRIGTWFYRLWNHSSCASSREDWRSTECTRSRASNDPTRLWCSTPLFFWGFSRSNYRHLPGMVGVCLNGCNIVLVWLALGGRLPLLVAFFVTKNFPFKFLPRSSGDLEVGFGSNF